MKKKLTATTAAMAALMGISSVALADGVKQFTPVEELQPEQRQAVYEQISQMTNGADLNWDQLAVGVDEDNQIVILQRNEFQMSAGAGSPSSFGRAAD